MPHTSALRRLAAVLLSGALSAASATALSQARTAVDLVQFNIAAQPMKNALKALAKQSDVQIIFTPASVRDLETDGVKGEMTTEQALDVLLKGTDLEYLREGDVVIVRNRAARSQASTGTPRADAQNGLAGKGSLHTARAESNPVAQRAGHGDARPQDRHETSDRGVPVFLDTVLVTGTLIRGAQSASPLVVIDRGDIEKTGYTTTQQVVQSIPQNFGGGESEGTVSSPGGSFLNVAFGSSVNLRGLGSDSTLVLLNGRRVAPAAYGQFVDVSLIPLSAVERIEILPDGASATYGSDAVGGVVNVILRDDYEGAETRLKAGSVTDGSLEEYQLSQALGADWGTGDALLTYEYFKRSSLDSTDRDYAANADQPFDLLPEQEAHNVLASLTADVSNRVRLHGTSLFSERDGEREAFNSFTGEPNREPTLTQQISAMAGAEYDIRGSWRGEVIGLYSRNKTRTDIFSPTRVRQGIRNRLELKSVETKVDGSMFALPGGDARLAVGASFRQESYRERRVGGLDDERDVVSAFGELSVPVFGVANERTGAQRLEISLAGRYEDYSDFGSTTNPKFGLLWAPLTGLKLRSTYGTSFRAPIFIELDGSNVGTLLLDFPDPASPDGTTLTMLISGNSAGVKPEEATTWSAGVDLEPSTAPQLQLSLTYFATKFEDRITEPLPGLEVLGIYAQADVYAPLIDRDPDPGTVSQLAAHPSFLNLYGPFAPEDVQAIVDRRRQNISTTRVSGLDLSGSYGLKTETGDWSFKVASTYLFEYAEAITPAAPENDILDTAYHQIDLKARGTVSWTYKGWSISAFLNYTDGFVNNTISPAASVGSWTTVDFQLGYKPGQSTWLKDARLSLNVLNLLDEDPPFMTSPVALFDIGFDPTNASPLGRFISVGVTKGW